MDGALPCDAIDRPPSPSWHGNGADKALTTSRDRQLLEAMLANPTASASVLADLLGVGKGSIVGRWRRLSAQGRLIKDRRGHFGGRWSCARLTLLMVTTR
jgi:hypothetical protein